MPRPEHAASTSAQLRQDIDSGRTGDKVAAPDPAAAPLGTDEEAAGTPPSPEDVALTRAAEPRGKRPRDPDRAGRMSTSAAPDGRPRGGRAAVWIGAGSGILAGACLGLAYGWLLVR
jgi:hypothetical protein